VITKNQQIILKPWSKVNLFLKVLGKKSNGYHEISTFIHPVSLFDEIRIKKTKNPDLSVNCKSEDLPPGQDVPLDKSNLVYKAARLFFENIGQEPRVAIDIIKRIPIGGGMGGGSSDAASTINGLNKLFGNILEAGVINEMCTSLGMDVAFFLDPRPALCTGRGEVIKKRFKPLKFWCILLNPGKSLSTKLVYETLNLTLTCRKRIDNISSLSNLPRTFLQEAGLLGAGDESIFKVVCKKAQSLTQKYALDSLTDIGNDLEDPAVRLLPDIGNGLDILKKAGAKRNIVCGSGSTVCGFVKSRIEAEEVVRKIKEETDQKWWIKVVPSLAV
jgi:4-diphosphocytidyl-2-C-methyl-D-erythritol kinase